MWRIDYFYDCYDFECNYDGHDSETSESSSDDDQYVDFGANCTLTKTHATLPEPQADTSTGWLALQLLWLIEMERISKKTHRSEDEVIMDTLDDLECNPQDHSCLPACALSRHKLLLSHDDGAAMLVALIRSYRTHLNANHDAYKRFDPIIKRPVLLVVLLQAALDVGIDDALAALIRVGANVHSSPGCSSMVIQPLRPVLAAACVDARVLQVLLAAKADVNDTTKRMTALTLACKLERLDEVNILLAADADPRVGRFERKTVFDIALQRLEDGILHALLKRHPDLVSSKEVFNRVLDRVINMRGKDLFELLFAMKWPTKTLPRNFIQPAFVHAARCGNITAVRYLLDAKADINRRGSARHLATALSEAAWHGHADLVATLLECGACVHTTDTKSQTALVENYDHDIFNDKLRLLRGLVPTEPLGWTPLHAAASGGFASVVKLLLDANADAKAVDRYGDIPLIDALYSGNMEVVRMLMDECGDVKMNGVSGQKALRYAVKHGRADLVKVLLDKGVDPNALDDAGRSLLMEAAVNDRADVAQVLVDKDVDLNVCNSDGESALSLATQHDFANVVKILLDKRANVNVCDACGHGALYHAAIRGSIDVLRTLIDNGVDVHNSSGKRALMAAIECGEADAVKVLIDAGADISAKRTHEDLSPLWAAMQKGAAGVVRVLLAAKADVEERNSVGQTPLIYAAEKSYRHTIKTLLAAKADLHAVDREGNTALTFALGLGNEVCNRSTYPNHMHYAGWLARRTDTFYSTMTHLAGDHNHQSWAIARWLIAAKAQVDVAKTFGCYALHDAVYDRKRVRTMVQAKADLSATDAHGATPLILAIQCYSNDVVHLLSSAWVVREALDKFSDTLLLDAIAEGRRDVAKVLIDAGVDVDVCNDNGDSAVMCAIATRQMSVLRALLASGANTDTANNQQVTPMQYAESQDNMVAMRALSATRISPNNCIPDPYKFWASAAEYTETTAYFLSRLEKDK